MGKHLLPDDEPDDDIEEEESDTPKAIEDDNPIDDSIADYDVAHKIETIDEDEYEDEDDEDYDDDDEDEDEAS